MKVSVTLLLFLSLLVMADCQNCMELNQSDYDESSYNQSRTYVIGNNSNDTDDDNNTVLVCECPANSRDDNQVCICTITNQYFDGVDCVCSEGYEWDGTGCQSCPYPCFRCGSGGSCQECEDGHLLINDTCEPLSEDMDGAFQADGALVECPGGCTACSSGGVCTTCSNGFYKQVDECLPCSQCKTCSSTGCSTCYRGLYVFNNTCVACPTNCLSCDGSQCTACEDGYYPSGNECIACQQDCTLCSASGCTRCDDRFSLVDDECVECLVGCSICSSSDITQCLGCSTGYYNSSTKCVPCDSKCSSCTSSTVCTACSEGYRLQGNTCVHLCTFPCMTCSTTNPASCSSCYGGYSLSGSSCFVNTSCNSSNTCQYCPRTYYLQAGNCLPCNIDNCISCRNDTEVTCTRCTGGYALNSNLECESCPSQCSRCSSLDFCTICVSGHYLYRDNGQSTGQCLVCSAADGCATCKNSGSNCVSCLSGYKLKENKCITRNLVNFQVELGVEPSDFYKTSNTFKDKLNEFVGNNNPNQNRRKITFNSIVEGSTVVAGTLNSQSSAQATSFSTTLDNSLTEGTTIGDMPIISATTTTTVEESSETEEESSTISLPTRTGLIVGVTILGAAIIILVIVAVIRSRNQGSRADKYKEEDDTGEAMKEEGTRKKKETEEKQEFYMDELYG